MFADDNKDDEHQHQHKRQPTSSPFMHERRSFDAYFSELIYVVGVPLIIISTVAIVFLLVEAKNILQPLMIALFFSYLLRPLITWLSVPVKDWCNCCRRGGGGGGGGGIQTVLPVSITTSTGTSAAANTAVTKPSNKKHDDDDDDGDDVFVTSTTSAAITADTIDLEEQKRRGRTINNHDDDDDEEEESHTLSESMQLLHPKIKGNTGRGGSFDGAVDCGPVRITRCPRWMAVLAALLICCGVIGAAVLMVADAVQTFENESLQIYEVEALKLRDKLIIWAKDHFDVDASFLAHQLSSSFSLSTLIQNLVMFLIDMVTGMILVVLFTLYLLFERTEQNNNPHSVRSKIDEQIQRYITLKTLISLAVAGMVYVILGFILPVRMANLFAVITFLLNFIPNVGPIVAGSVSEWLDVV